MCGIAGAISLTTGAIPSQFGVAAMTRQLAHRGPDASGLLHRSGFSFGHCRLSIIDASPHANQPMSDRAGAVHLVYNGEIYNYKELRSCLAQSGCQFDTASDAEVLLECYKRWGIKGVQRFNGMFAFVIFDSRHQLAFLARDRLGIKPIYYVTVKDTLLFASEVQALLAYPGSAKRLNAHGVSSFVSFRHVLGTETLYEGIKAIPPGHFLTVTNGRVLLSCYWKLQLTTNAGAQPDTPELRSLVADAVRLNTAGDLPVSLLLSGGLDSSILACELSKVQPAGVNCYCA